MKDGVLQSILRAWNEGEIDAIDEFFAQDAVVHNLGRGEDYEDRESFKAWIREVRDEFPDLTIETFEPVVGDDKLVYQWRSSGTNEGEFVPVGQPSTNEFAEWEGVSVYRFEDETVVEAWYYYDMLGLLRQLGMAPSTHS
jgi:steroid delta-isomerase-like uncharacterized protein